MSHCGGHYRRGRLFLGKLWFRREGVPIRGDGRTGSGRGHSATQTIQSSTPGTRGALLTSATPINLIKETR